MILEKLLATPDWVITTGLVMVAFVGVVSILFEVLEIIFLLTPSEKDDLWLSKVRDKWDRVKPYFEWFHIKTPLAKVLAKVLTGVQIIKSFVLKYKQKKTDGNKPTDEDPAT
jgi:hypothetical protein